MLIKYDQAFGNHILGIDEAGRGPLAGPVVSACVYWKKYSDQIPINDSKQLSAHKRQKIFDTLISIRNQDIFWGIGISSVKEIDTINILEATKLSMKRAYKNCLKKIRVIPSTTLIDGDKTFETNNEKLIPIIKGDQKSQVIATASIIAKVLRDKIMDSLHIMHPAYQWAQNKGYGTKKHLEGIKQFGITPYHRITFKPISQYA